MVCWYAKSVVYLSPGQGVDGFTGDGGTGGHALAADAGYEMDHAVDGLAVDLGILRHAVDSVPALCDFPARKLDELSCLGENERFDACVQDFTQVPRNVLVRIADDKAAVRVLDDEDVDAGFQHSRGDGLLVQPGPTGTDRKCRVTAQRQTRGHRRRQVQLRLRRRSQHLQLAALEAGRDESLGKERAQIRAVAHD